MNRKKREKLCKDKDQGCSGPAGKGVSYTTGSRTESVNKENSPCSKRFPPYFAERTRCFRLLNIKPVTLTDFRLNLTGSRDRNRRHYYFNLK